MDKKISEESYLPASGFNGNEEFVLEKSGANFKTKSIDLRGITQISRVNLIALRNVNNLLRGFYHIVDSTPPLIVFAPNNSLIRKWAISLDSDYNKFIEYDLDADVVTWVGEFLRQPYVTSTIAAQLDYVIPFDSTAGWVIDMVQLENMMLTPSQYTLTGTSFSLVMDSGDISAGMHLKIIGRKS